MGMQIVKTNYPNVSKLLTAGFLMGFLLVWACEKTEIMDERDIDFISLKRLNDCPAIVVSSQLLDEFLVINTQEELEQSIFVGEKNISLCEELKEELNIDFTKYTLLIGKTKIPHVEGNLISENVFRPGDKNYTYSVIIRNGGYTALGLFRFGVLIPKIDNDIEVDLEVEIQEHL